MAAVLAALGFADRWHLLKNLRESLVRVVDRHGRQAEAAARAATISEPESLIDTPVVGTATETPVIAASLIDDLAAVKVALGLPQSNAQTEGHVNRLKLIKRQM